MTLTFEDMACAYADASPNCDWVLVSNNRANSLRLTGIVHHVNGCGVNNGRNQLFKIPADEAAELKHCMRCEAMPGTVGPVTGVGAIE